ncbi:MAG: hypothetical protein ABI663_11035 [Chryseolinea sp.]
MASESIPAQTEVNSVIKGLWDESAYRVPGVCLAIPFIANDSHRNNNDTSSKQQ